MVADSGQRMTPEMRKCINDCLAAHSVCMETVGYCLDQGGKTADGRLIRMLLDAAEMSRTAANFMLRCSELHERVCAVTAEVAAACARACSELESDQQLQACAEACLRCASSCKQMVARQEASLDWDKVSADSYPASDPPATMAGAARP